MTIVRTVTPAGEAIVILPEAEFERLRDLAEDGADTRTIEASLARLRTGEDELLTEADLEKIGLPLARRIALAAQGFGVKRPEAPGAAHLRRNLERLHLHQIDSVNVLSRAHYLPAFSRLGHYDRGDLDRLAWGKRRERRLFEYWAHEASLLPFPF